MTIADHRTSSRVRSFLRGEIIHSNGFSKTECTVRDISADGARIEAPPSVTVPEYFDLVIPQRNAVHRSRIVWRHGSELGVSFEDVQHAPAPVTTPAKASPPDDGPLELKIRMLELEAEIAKLRSQFAEMQAAINTLAKDGTKDRAKEQKSA